MPLLLLAAALASCARAPLRSEKPAGFRAVETQHFALYTDLAPEDADEQGRRLEQLLVALQETGWESTGDLPLKMNVIMFARERDFECFARDGTGGFAVGKELFEPWMVLPAPPFGEEYSVIAHELTHVMSFQAFMHQPRWFSEGLASYFESAHFLVDGSFQVGAVSRSRHAWLGQGWDTPSELIHGQGSDHEARFYASSWLLVHFLMTRHPDAFVAFQDQLARGVSGPEAWLRAFPKLSGDALDEALLGYWRAGVYESFISELAWRPDISVRSHALSLADEHALLALLWKNCHGCSAQERGHARLEVEQALRLEPDNVRAVALSINLGLEGAQAALVRAQALVRTHPDEWLAWIALGVAGMATGELAAMSRQPETDPGARAARLAPTQPYALAVQALTAALRGERAFAIDRMKTAQRLQPTNVDLMKMGAHLLLGFSACSEARALLTKIAENAHAYPDPRHFHDLRQQVMKCQEGVPSAGVAPPAASEAQP